MRLSWLVAVAFVALAGWMYQSQDVDTLRMLFPAINWAQACVLACVIRARTRTRPAA